LGNHEGVGKRMEKNCVKDSVGCAKDTSLGQQNTKKERKLQRELT
jgi:hypothetical protein